MSEIQTGGGEQKKGKPKKMSLRVDFTPMVDMNMLLITFFMFCTSLAKPQTMDITMPVKDDKVIESERNKVADDKAITVILGEKNKIYYYFGKPNYKDYNSLKVGNYGSSEDKNSLRSVLLGRNKVSIANIRKLRDMKARKQIKQADYDLQVKKIKNDKNGQVVIIKPTDESTYKNLVDALDEMQICSIGIYAIVAVEQPDRFLMDNLKKAGALTAASDFEKANAK
ncbi:MAG: biopolymer transporter ExbD [Bacteroidia bacterium]|nr:biopolymer transporter ExbD [Bacteroidia bacterium]